MPTHVLFVQALTPLHAGTGQGIGVIDLPIAREKATGIPYLPGSSLKGSLRDACTDLAARNTVFGPETQNASDYAGAAHFGDARLVLLPVRSAAGTFAYVTSPYLLSRLARDVQEIGLTTPAAQTIAAKNACLVEANSALKLQIGNTTTVVLEDLDLLPTTENTWAAWFDTHVQAGIGQRLCIVHDDVMSYLLETATEVVARIAIDNETKTVQRGALWYEESLPTESLLVSLVVTQTSRNVKNDPHRDVTAVIRDLCLTAKQFGGKATVGRGMCQLKLVGGAP